MRLPFLASIAVCACVSPAAHALAAGHQDVLPVKIGAGAVSLEGAWQFKYLPTSKLGSLEAFFQPDFDAAAWASIRVPSHWELQGFAEPKYKKVDEGTGLYRRTFRLPAAWRGQRVFLRFDGVLYGLTAWVNGRLVGEWASSYNPVSFDITGALRPGEADNLLAVRVTTRSKGWEFDTNDCWALSGIYREVTLFAVPPVHLVDYTARTTLGADGRAQLQLEVAASAAATVNGRLLAPDGRAVRDFQIVLGPDGRGTTNLSVAQPRLWTAETPALYRLELALEGGGQTVQRFTDRLGLREVAIVDGILRLNGTPIKLRGVNHHDIWPAEGRVATEPLIRRDLALMQAAHINFVRTSHYPPHPRLIELCDEMGLYVMCEVPFGFGDKNLTDPSYEATLLTRARATVMRDKNRPSVIVWSVGNENPLTALGLATARRVKELDPTRPLCLPTNGSYFEANLPRFLELPEFVDVFAPHYPEVDRVRQYAARLPRPVIFTEYAHALGLATDRIQDEWEIMQASPRIAGGAIWMFQDQGLLRPANAPVDPSARTNYVWPDARHFYDTSGTDGADGIVYSDRTPQTDYWQVRQVYAPVRIAERRHSVRPGAQEISLRVENRHDFRDLAGCKLQWALRVNGRVLQSGAEPLHARPQGQETVTLRLNLPADFAASICALETKCVDRAERELGERVLRLEGAGAPARAAQLCADLPAAAEPRVVAEGAVTRVEHERFTVNVQRESGVIAIRSRDGRTLVAGFHPHVGRRFTLAEEARAARKPIWQESELRNPELPQAAVERTPDGVRVVVRGKYLRHDAGGPFLAGEHSLLITARGTIEVAYDYAPGKAEGEFLEAGIALVCPATAATLRWVGQGPYAGYPGKDALNEFGIHALDRGDLRFQGNRREVEVAVLTDETGAGLALAGAAIDVAVENTATGVVLSHNALVAGRGNKRVEPETMVRSEDVKRIAGRFTLVPLGPTWPPTLSAWLGAPQERPAPLRPFFHSYDQ